MNSIITKGAKREDEFEYIKDSDMIRCPMGKLATSKKYIKETTNTKGKHVNARMSYKFAEYDCQQCPKCKTYSIRILSDIHKK